MNTSPTGWVASYRSPEEPDGPRLALPVIGWDEDGSALVVDQAKAKRVRATEMPNFAGLIQARSYAVTAVPGGGWRVEFTEPDGTTTSEPVVAWVICQDGDARPLYHDGGFGLPLTFGDGLKWRVYHPEAYKAAPPRKSP